MRKSKIINLKDRDNELTFKITEMAASKLENWTIKAVMLLASSSINVPDGADITQAAAYLQKEGLKALSGLDYNKAKPLLDEMLACCSRIDGGIEQVCTPETVDGYIEDMRTLFVLRMEAVKMNFNFFAVEKLSASPENPPIRMNAVRKA